MSQPLSEPRRAARPAARRVPEEKGERDRERKRGRERVACSAQLPAPCRGPSPFFLPANRPANRQAELVLLLDEHSVLVQRLPPRAAKVPCDQRSPLNWRSHRQLWRGGRRAHFRHGGDRRCVGLCLGCARTALARLVPGGRVWGEEPARPCALARARTMHIGTACADGPGRAHPPPAASHDRCADLARQHTRLRQPAPACRLANPAAQPTIRGRHRWHDRELRVFQVLNDETDWVLSEPKGVRARRPACRSWDAS